VVLPMQPCRPTLFKRAIAPVYSTDSEGKRGLAFVPDLTGSVP